MSQGRSTAVKALRNRLDRHFHAFHHRRYVHPDPLECLYRYPRVRDREVAGLVAAALAYGRVTQILRSVERVLSELGPLPRDTLIRIRPSTLRRRLRGFVHRFADGRQMAALLMAVREVVARHGSLGESFLEGYSSAAPTVHPALCRWVRTIEDAGGNGAGHLLPAPDKGSAAKRLHLYLRWMVRKDEVDPGGWDSIPPAKLIVPLDVHMHRIAIELGLTCRKTPDLKTALEVTEGFRAVAPRDPVRYDFALTRMGIRRDVDWKAFRDCGESGREEGS
jgi:uncharacterized protein (TIGR02757 family)